MLPTKKQVIELIYKYPLKIAHRLGFSLLSDIHNKLLKDLIFVKKDETYIWHRGSYKTTCVSLAFALFMILFPNENIIFMRKTDNDVAEIMKQVSNILQHNYTKTLVWILYGINLVMITCNNSEISTNLVTSTRGVSQLLGLGIKTSLTGKHADWVHTDDIVNLRDRVSKAERDYTKTIYQELQNIRNRGGKISNTCTKWHKDDAIEKLMSNHKILDCYTSNLIPKDTLDLLRKAMTPSLFAANYELKHIADDNALFKVTPTFNDNMELFYGGQHHIDAAYGGEDGCAWTSIKYDKNNNKFYAIGKIRESKHIDSCLTEFILFAKKYRCGTLHLEENADKGYLAKDCSKQGMIVASYHESTNKFIKIATYLKFNWSNIIWHTETDPEYISQIMDYTEDASHDDAPDSCASLIRALSDPNEVKFY